MQNFRSDYLNYSQLTTQLQQWAAEHPGFVTLRSIGKTTEGRDIWTLIIGPEPERVRPAAWVDGNMHATELCGSSVALGIAEDLIALHRGENPRDLPATLLRTLRDVLFYVTPRLSPDGAEAVLSTGRYVRSTPRDTRPNQSRSY